MGEEGGKTNFRNLVHGLVQNTGMHGIPNIQRSKSLRRKMFWLAVLSFGLGMMIWQVIVAFLKYYSYPVETSTTPLTNTSLIFPAVTFCNLNPIRLSGLEDIGPEFVALFGQPGPDPTPAGNESANNQTFTPFDWDTQSQQEGYLETEDANFALMEELTQMVSELKVNQVVMAGHELKTMLISCSYMGKPCIPKNFTRVHNPKYGNCFTFNTGGKDNIDYLEASKVGPMFGLELQLYVQQDEYLPMTQSAGARLLIHNQTDVPFPEDEGLSLATGTENYIGITRAETYRAEPPYGNCVNDEDSANLNMNMYEDIYDSVTYSTAACTKTCYQLAVVESCDCGDSNFPMNSTALLQVSDNDYTRPCKSDKQAKCLNDVGNRYASGSLNCSQVCPPPCFYADHQQTISFASWPAERAQSEIFDKLMMLSQSMWDMINNQDESKNAEFVKTNVLKLIIYFNKMDFVVVTTASSYNIDSLLSALGGQVGLWLGLSVITLVEFVELFLDVSLIAYTKLAPSGDKKKIGDEDHTKKKVIGAFSLK